MTSPAHPYDPATVTADRRPSDDHPRHYRAAIAATYHGPGARGAPMRATARRLADVIGADPDPAAVAQALAALGGCPAVIATLQGAAS
jgi:hypothetical protein